MVHFGAADIIAAFDQDHRAEVALTAEDTAWNPHPAEGDIAGPGWITYQEFPDGSWTARISRPNTTQTYYRSDPHD